jgi:hypothetical protein
MPSLEREFVTDEVTSLNAANLDVEELEARLEMAVAVPNDDCWTDICLIHL